MPLSCLYDVALLNDVVDDAESTRKSISTFISSFDMRFTRLGFENACRITRQASRFNKRSQSLSKDTHLLFSTIHVSCGYVPQLYYMHTIWASARENLSSEVCEQQRRRPACASAQTDQSLCYSLIKKHYI